jgi:RNA polymerase subunit RPABC4/transcription elongation factor Spt4
MPDIHIPAAVITGLQVILAFTGAFVIALWLSLIIWTFKDARSRSRDVFSILLATLMVVIFGPLGLLLYFLLRPNTTLAELYERSLEEEALLQDLEERPRCSGCSRQVHESWIICPDCHTTLKKTCRHCENRLDLAWTVCPVCGTSVDEPEPQEAHPHDYQDYPPQPVDADMTAHQQTRPMTPPPEAVVNVAIPTPPAAGGSGDKTRPQFPTSDSI